MNQTKPPSAEFRNIKGAKNHRLIQERKKRKLTQKELGDIVGVSQSRIEQLESGRTTPSLDLALALQGYFGLSDDILFPDE